MIRCWCWLTRQGQRATRARFHVSIRCWILSFEWWSDAKFAAGRIGQNLWRERGRLALKFRLRGEKFGACRATICRFCQFAAVFLPILPIVNLGGDSGLKRRNGEWEVGTSLIHFITANYRINVLICQAVFSSIGGTAFSGGACFSGCPHPKPLRVPIAMAEGALKATGAKFERILWRKFVSTVSCGATIATTV